MKKYRHLLAMGILWYGAVCGGPKPHSCYLPTLITGPSLPRYVQLPYENGICALPGTVPTGQLEILTWVTDNGDCGLP
jgi:hypothetical protein